MRFEVVKFNNLSQAPERVTRLGALPVRCWVADTDLAQKYSLWSDLPFDPDMTNANILKNLTILGESSPPQ